MTQQYRTPVTVLGGFPEKTTLRKQILQGDHGMRIAVIVNEFGKDTDNNLVRDLDGLTSATMKNGCICFTLSNSLGETLEKLAGQRDLFDHLVIEMSSLANPIPIAHHFMAEGPVQENFALRNIIILVDALSYHQDLDKKHGLWAGQIRAADMVLIDKVDLIKPEDALALQQFVHELNPLAIIHQTHQMPVNLQHVLQSDSTARLLVNNSGIRIHHLPQSHESVTAQSISVTLHEEGNLDPYRTNAFLGELLTTWGDSVDKIVGIFCLQDRKGTSVIRGVREQIEVSEGGDWTDGVRRSKIVIIGNRRVIDANALTASFRACLVTSPPAQEVAFSLLGTNPQAPENVTLQREHIPRSIADRYGPCASCTLRIPLDQTLVEADQCLTDYGSALRKSELSSVKAGNNLDTKFTAVFDAWHSLTTALYTFVEALRVDRAVVISLYLTGDKYGVTNLNRVRIGVMAHDSWWKRTQRCRATLAESFARLESVHADLSHAIQPVLSSMDAAVGDFLNNGFQPLSRFQSTIEQQMGAFTAQAEKWLTTKRKAARNVLGLSTKS